MNMNMNDRIEFLYDREKKFIAKLYSEGKVRIVKDKRDVGSLMRICHKNGYSVQGDGIITERANKRFYQ